MKKIFSLIIMLAAPCWLFANPLPSLLITEVQISPTPRFELWTIGTKAFHLYAVKTKAGTFPISDFTIPENGYFEINDDLIIGTFALNSIRDTITLIDSLGYVKATVRWPEDSYYEYTFNPPSNGYSAAKYTVVDSFFCFDPWTGEEWWEIETYSDWHTDWPTSFGLPNPASPSAIELSQFSAQPNANGVELLWNTESESDNYQWFIERSTEPTSNYLEVARMPAQSRGDVGANYSYNDKSVLANSSYYYRLGDQDKNGNVTWHGPVYVSTKAQSVGSPASSGLNIKAFPNPARAQTVLSYAVPPGEDYNLKLYDLSGRLVKNLDQGKGKGGYINIQWHGDNEDQKAVSSGNYLAVLSSGGQKTTQKITWLK